MHYVIYLLVVCYLLGAVFRVLSVGVCCFGVCWCVLFGGFLLDLVCCWLFGCFCAWLCAMVVSVCCVCCCRLCVFCFVCRLLFVVLGFLWRVLLLCVFVCSFVFYVLFAICVFVVRCFLRVCRLSCVGGWFVVRSLACVAFGGFVVLVFVLVVGCLLFGMCFVIVRWLVFVAYCLSLIDAFFSLLIVI